MPGVQEQANSRGRMHGVYHLKTTNITAGWRNLAKYDELVSEDTANERRFIVESRCLHGLPIS